MASWCRYHYQPWSLPCRDKFGQTNVFGWFECLIGFRIYFIPPEEWNGPNLPLDINLQWIKIKSTLRFAWNSSREGTALTYSTWTRMHELFQSLPFQIIPSRWRRKSTLYDLLLRFYWYFVTIAWQSVIYRPNGLLRFERGRRIIPLLSRSILRSTSLRIFHSPIISWFSNAMSPEADVSGSHRCVPCQLSHSSRKNHTWDHHVILYLGVDKVLDSCWVVRVVLQ